MTNINHFITKAEKRKRRVRSRISGTAKKPRLTVSRANKHFYIQVVNDVDGVTLMSANDLKIRKNLKKTEKLTKTESAILATKELITKIKKAKIETLIFDRGQYKYHGRVKAVAETLRNSGIKV